MYCDSQFVRPEQRVSYIIILVEDKKVKVHKNHQCTESRPTSGAECIDGNRVIRQGEFQEVPERTKTYKKEQKVPNN